MPPVAFVVALLLLSLLLVVPLDLASYFFDLPAPEEHPLTGTLWRDVIRAVLLAPLLETALYQALPIYLSRIWRINIWVSVFASATVFGLSHSYSAAYVVATFLAGLVLAYGFALKNRIGDRPFLLISATHVLMNAIALTAIY